MTVAVAEVPVAKTTIAKKSGRKIPDYLIREVIDGIPFYYAGYRSVMNKTKNIDDIMPHSTLQGLIKNYIGDELKAKIDRKKFFVFVGETGVHINLNNNLGLDVAVFDKTKLTPDKIGDKYADVAPDLVVEVDVNVELPDRQANLFDEFVMRKLRRLFAFGIKKIIWVFTKSKTVIVATPDVPWHIMDWNRDIELFEGINFNIEKYLLEEGIKNDEL